MYWRSLAQCFYNAKRIIGSSDFLPSERHMCSCDVAPTMLVQERGVSSR